MKTAGNQDESAESTRTGLWMDNRGEKRTDRIVVKRLAKKTWKNQKVRKARKIQEWKRYRSLRRDITRKWRIMKYQKRYLYVQITQIGEIETEKKRKTSEPIPIQKNQPTERFLSKNKRWSGVNQTYNPVKINAKYHQKWTKNERICLHKSIQIGLSSHETVTQLYLPNDGESLPWEFDKPLKIKGFWPVFVLKKVFFVILTETLAYSFFLWYDFRGFVYPFWGDLKHPNLPKCNFYVTEDKKRAEGSGREYPQDDEER